MTIWVGVLPPSPMFLWHSIDRGCSVINSRLWPPGSGVIVALQLQCKSAATKIIIPSTFERFINLLYHSNTVLSCMCIRANLLHKNCWVWHVAFMCTRAYPLPKINVHLSPCTYPLYKSIHIFDMLCCMSVHSCLPTVQNVMFVMLVHSCVSIAQ